MLVEIVKAGKFPNSFECLVDGKKTYLSAGKFCKTAIVPGKTYEIETWQKEGTKTVYINKATEVTTEVKGEVKVETKAEPKPTPTTKPFVKPTASASMSKEEWAEKDKGIKWLTCIKAAAVFHAHRPDSDIDNVINDALALFVKNPTETINNIKEASMDKPKPHQIFNDKKDEVIDVETDVETDIFE